MNCRCSNELETIDVCKKHYYPLQMKYSHALHMYSHQNYSGKGGETRSDKKKTFKFPLQSKLMILEVLPRTFLVKLYIGVSAN